jgi:hypothetical protein
MRMPAAITMATRSENSAISGGRNPAVIPPTKANGVWAERLCRHTKVCNATATTSTPACSSAGV